MCAQAKLEPVDHESNIQMYEAKYREQLSNPPANDAVMMIVSIAKTMRDLRDADGNIDLRQHPALKDRAIKVMKESGLNLSDKSLFPPSDKTEGVYTHCTNFFDSIHFVAARKKMMNPSELYSDLYKLTHAYSQDAMMLSFDQEEVKTLTTQFHDIDTLSQNLSAGIKKLSEQFGLIKSLLQQNKEKEEPIEEKKEPIKLDEKTIETLLPLHLKFKEIKSQCIKDAEVFARQSLQAVRTAELIMRKDLRELHLASANERYSLAEEAIRLINNF